MVELVRPGRRGDRRSGLARLLGAGKGAPDGQALVNAGTPQKPLTSNAAPTPTIQTKTTSTTITTSNSVTGSGFSYHGPRGVSGIVSSLPTAQNLCPPEEGRKYAKRCCSDHWCGRGINRLAGDARRGDQSVRAAPRGVTCALCEGALIPWSLCRPSTVWQLGTFLANDTMNTQRRIPCLVLATSAPVME